MQLGKSWRKYLLSLIMVIFLAVELPVIIAGYSLKPVPSDVMIVLGSRLYGSQPGPMLKLRLAEAERLYREGFASAVIVSGAKGDDEDTSEAAAMRDYLVEKGIPRESIYIEDKSFNTYQNLLNSQEIMAARGFKSAVIVTNASHIRRCLFLAKQLGMSASGAPAPMADNLYLTAKNYLREGAAMLALTFR